MERTENPLPHWPEVGPKMQRSECLVDLSRSSKKKLTSIFGVKVKNGTFFL